MAETVFAITRPSAKTSVRAVGSGFFLEPGQSVSVPLSKVTPQLVSDVIAAEFTSVPALPRDIVDEDASVPKLVDWVRSRNTKFVLNGNVNGGAGVISLNGEVQVQDADSVLNTLGDGLRIKVKVNSGNGKINGTVLTDDTLTLVNGKASFTVQLAAAALNTTVIGLENVDGNTLDVTDTADFQFNP